MRKPNLIATICFTAFMGAAQADANPLSQAELRSVLSDFGIDDPTTAGFTATVNCSLRGQTADAEAQPLHSSQSWMIPLTDNGVEMRLNPKAYQQLTAEFRRYQRDYPNHEWSVVCGNDRSFHWLSPAVIRRLGW